MKAIGELLMQAHKSLIFLEKTIIILLLFSMIFLHFGQVVLRNVFHGGAMWVDEVTKIAMIWVTFLGAGLATEYNRHVKIDVLTHLMGGGRAGKVVDSLAQLFACFICGLLAWAAITNMIAAAEYPTYELVKFIPDYAFYVIMPYFFIVAAIRCLINLGRIQTGKYVRTIEP